MHGPPQHHTASAVAEQAIVEGLRLAGRATAGVAQLALLALRHAVRKIGEVTEKVRAERARLQGIDPDGGRSLGEGREQQRRPLTDGREPQQRQGRTDQPQQTQRGTQRPQRTQPGPQRPQATGDRPARENADRKSARDFLAQAVDLLYLILPEKWRERVPREAFHDAFSRVGEASVRKEEKAHDERIRDRWGSDVNLDDAWKQAAGPGGSQRLRTPEDALIVWASAARSDSPDATKSRVAAEMKLREHVPDVMHEYDRNRTQGNAPWEAMSKAYHDVTARNNNAGRTTARETRQSDSQAAGRPNGPARSPLGQAALPVSHALRSPGGRRPAHEAGAADSPSRPTHTETAIRRPGKQL